MNMEAINNAAEKYALQSDLITYGVVGKEAFKAGALSDAAKQYWFEQFKAEQSANIEEEQFKEFEEWWNSLQYKTPEIVFKHFKRYFPFKAEQKQTIVTDLPAPPYDDSVTHNLELKEI